MSSDRSVLRYVPPGRRRAAAVRAAGALQPQDLKHRLRGRYGLLGHLVLWLNRQGGRSPDSSAPLPADAEDRQAALDAALAMFCGWWRTTTKPQPEGTDTFGPAAVRCLIELGANPTTYVNGAGTCLHYAAYTGRVGVVAALLEAMAPDDAVAAKRLENGNGETPSCSAVQGSALLTRPAAEIRELRTSRVLDRDRTTAHYCELTRLLQASS